MKKIQILTLAISLPLISCGQQLSPTSLPSLVQNGLKVQFPNADNVEWERDGKLYEAEFNLHQTEYTALLDATGKMVMHKHDLAQTALPERLALALQRDYAAYKLEDLEAVVQNGETLYQVELDKNNTGLSSIFNQETKKVFTAEGQESEFSYWD